MADNRQIVGWFYRNGKRIPIFEKSSSKKGAIKKAQDKLAHTLGSGESYAYVDSVGLSGKVAYHKTVNVPSYYDPDTGITSYDTETEYGTVKMPLRAGKGKAQLRKNASKSQDKYITDKVGANGYKYKSVDYDTPGGHVHKDVETKEEARQFLRRNNVLKVKQRMK